MDNKAIIEKRTTDSIFEESTGLVAWRWLFLFTELILFGGLLIVYAFFRLKYRDNFGIGAMKLDTLLGLFNTILLLSSSMMMVLALVALKRKQKLFSMFLIIFTIVFGVMFLFNKLFEWSVIFHYGLYPQGSGAVDLESGEIVFFSLFNLMTWLHALHIIAGLIFLIIIFIYIYKDKTTFEHSERLGNMGVFWHSLVIVWIFLFPLLYLLK
jgi:cytochrome c oxidase subunit III